MTHINNEIKKGDKDMNFELFKQIFQLVHQYHDVFANLLSLLLKCSGKDDIK